MLHAPMCSPASFNPWSHFPGVAARRVAAGGGGQSVTPSPSPKAGARDAKCVGLETAKLVAICCAVTKTEFAISGVSTQAKFGVGVEDEADLFQTILNLDSLPMKGREKNNQKSGRTIIHKSTVFHAQVRPPA